MERHWQLVTRRLSNAVTRDIAAVIEIIETYPQDSVFPKSRASPPRRSASRSRSCRPTRCPRRPRPFFSLLDSTLSAGIRDEIKRPFWIDTVGNSDMVEIRIALEGPRAAGLCPAQPRLRLELADLPGLDGRRIPGADRHRAPLPAQPDQADPDARPRRRAIRQGPAGLRLQAARGARGAPGSAGLHRHARAHRAADRAAHDDALGRQPRPPHHPHPLQARARDDRRHARHAGAEGRRRRDEPHAGGLSRLRAGRRRRGDGGGRPAGAAGGGGGRRPSRRRPGDDRLRGRAAGALARRSASAAASPISSAMPASTPSASS